MQADEEETGKQTLLGEHHYYLEEAKAISRRNATFAERKATINNVSSFNETTIAGKVARRQSFGLMIEATSLYLMSQLTTQVDYSHLVMLRMLQASGLAFLFVPITSTAYIGLPVDKNINASALVNLSRNLGGSFGISLAQAFIARRAQYHQSQLVEELTAKLGNADAAQQVILHNVQQQAAMMSYLDNFWMSSLLMLLMLCVVPLTLLMSKTKPGESAHARH